MKAQAAGKRAIRTAHGIIDTFVLTIILLLLAFGGYALWDSNQIYQAADKSHYEIYKPTEENAGKSFQELQAINGDVFSWLTIYGTNIDYPVTQYEDNMKYVNTNAEGKYSLSGAIFLDCNNSKDFSDFNSILYGHHMEKQAMFGEIGNFSNKGMFDSHRYGNLYYDGKDHGVEFFAFIHSDAYDGTVFTANVLGDEGKQALLDELRGKAMYKRDISVTTEDHILLLTTCSSESTNGRDILVGKIGDAVFADSFEKENDEGMQDGGALRADSRQGFFEGVPILLQVLLIVIAAILLILLIIQKYGHKDGRNGTETEGKHGTRNE